MKDTLYIAAYNESHLLVTSNSASVERELRGLFTFEVPGARYMPAFKQGRWDGRISLYNGTTKTIYRGLLPRILKFAKEYGCEVDMDDTAYVPNKFTMQDIEQCVEELNLPVKPYDYQLQSILECVNKKRLTLLSPTGSGKSLIIYVVAQFLHIKTLVIVPTRALVSQMEGDFRDYGYQEDIHLIYAGKDKDSDARISVTTWQSLLRVNREWFDQFDCVIVDETHQAKAKSLTNILEKMISTEYRFGTTGTLDGEQTNRLIIEGLLGPIFRIVTTSELMEDNVLSSLKIRALVLQHDDEICLEAKKWDYPKEVRYVIKNEKRNRFITNLVTKIPGNNLVLFRFVEQHGDVLHKMIQEATDRPIYYIHGGIDGGVRDAMRAAIEKETDAIILAGVQAFATGSNVKMLNNIFFTHPSKSRIVTLQAIGRVLRRTEGKTTATLYDITDDLRVESAGKANFSMKHFGERIKIYKSERFDYKIKEVKF
jgi:superfamily II DNA or RNA helicase